MAENLGRAILEITTDDSKFEANLKSDEAKAKAFVSNVKQLFSTIKLNLDEGGFNQFAKAAEGSLKSISSAVKEDGSVMQSLKFETAAAASSMEKLTQSKIQLASATSELKNRLSEEKAAQQSAIADMKAEQYAQTAQSKRGLSEQTAQLKMRLMEEKAANDQAKSGLEGLKSVASAVGSGISKLASEIGKGGSALVSLVGHIGSAVGKLAELGAAAGGAAASGLGKLASAAESAIAGLAKLAAAGGAAFAALAGVGVKSAAALEESVNNIASIKPDIDTSAVFKSLNEMSTRVPQTAAQLGDSLYNVFSSIDVTSEGALKLVEQFSKGAVGAQTDAATFGTAIVGQMNAYKLSVDDAAHLSDVFFNTVKNGVVTGQELASSLGPVTGSAKAAGVSIDELGALIAGVTKEGGPAAQNINNLNNLFMKFSTKEAQSAMKSVGVAATDSTGKFRPMIDVMGDLKAKLDVMTPAAKANALQAIFPDAQARQGAQTIMSELDNVKGFLDENIHKSGAAEAAYQQMVKGFSAQTKLLVNTLKASLTTIGGAILPVITPLVTGLTNGLKKAQPEIEAFSKRLAGTIQEGINAATRAISTIKDWPKAFGQAIDGITGKTKDLGLLTGVINEIFGPGTGAKVAAVIQEIGAKFGPLIFNILRLVDAFNPLKLAFATFQGFMSGGVNGAVDAFTTRLGAIGTTIQLALPQIVAGLGQIATQILGWITAQAPAFLTGFAQWAISFVNWVAPVAGQLLGQLATLIGQVLGWIAANGPMLLTQLASWTVSFVQWAAPIVGQLLGQLGQVLLSVVNWIIANGPQILSTLASWATSFIEWIAPAIPTILGKLGELIGMLIGWVVAQAPVLLAQLMTWGEQLWNWISPQIPGMMAKLGELIGQVISWIGEQAPVIMNQLSEWGQQFWAWIQPQIGPMLSQLGELSGQVFGWIVAQAPGIIAQLVSWSLAFTEWLITDVMPKIPGLLGDLLSGILSWIGGAVGQIAPTFQGWVTSFTQWVQDVITALPGNLAGIASTIVGWVVGAAGTLLSEAAQIGSNIIAGIVNGIMGGAGQIIGAVKNIAGQALGGIMGALGIHSPSEEMKNKAGKPISQGIAAGILDAAKSVTSAMAEIGKAIGKAGLEEVAKQAETIAKIAESASKMASALTSVKTASGVGSEQIAKFAANVQAMISAFTTSAAKFNDKMLKSADDYSATAGKVADGGLKMVSLFEKLKDYGGVNQAQIEVFNANTYQLINAFVAASLKFKAEMLTSATTYADSAGKVADNALKMLTLLEKLTKYSSVSEGNIEMFNANVYQLINAFSAAADDFDVEMLDSVSKYADTAGKVADDGLKMVNLLEKLSKYAPVAQGNIEQFNANIYELMNAFAAASVDFDKGMLDSVAKYADTAGKVADGGLKAVTLLGELGKYSSIGIGHIEMFNADLMELVNAFMSASLSFDEKGLKGAATYAEAAGKMVAVVGPGITALTALAGYKTVASGLVDQFMRDLNNLVTDFVESSGWFDAEGLKGAAAYADAVKKMVDVIGPGVSGLAALHDYSHIANESVDIFIQDLNNLVGDFVESAGWFDAEGLKAASAFADSAKKITDILSSGVSGFTALLTYKSVPQSVIESFVSDITLAVNLASVAAMKMDTEMLVQVGKFGESVGKIFTGFKAAMDLFASLKDFKSTPSTTIQQFIDEVTFTVALATAMAQKADTELVAQAVKFGESIGKIFNG
jgi:TP901 family phage tail tape measure protein